ncbi:Hsp70 family protein [Virgisporangium ochraceum]|uniref:Hsp70 family protein n=1 Tax=Virgisporangium ochraceum TaxID=65505 RepID=A0A8J4A058_9ACTN|nr:Hsp70 family protein [Virgisporangium ochraceum]GIJ71468.1 hypothetical protein Voc01_063850 [Virgisporangium ochraceum]
MTGIDAVCRLGVDLGTTTTVAVLSEGGDPPTPLLFDSSPSLRSAVFHRADTGVLTGIDAERAGVGYPAGLEPNPKRRIDEGTVWLGESEIAVVDLLAALLRRVAEQARRVAGRDPDDVVLTHPAGWGRARLGVLAAAAELAGWPACRFLPEPVAAAAYFTTVLGVQVPAGGSVVVYDLGAGTFDVAVLRRDVDGFAVVAVDGLTDVGGLDLDAALVGHVRARTADAAEWDRLESPRTLADRHARRALWDDVRTAKELLSRHVVADLHVPLVDVDLHITRAEFDQVAAAPIGRSVEVTAAATRRAAVRLDAGGGVFLVGGASRVPLVATMLHRALDVAPTTIGEPELAVALGSLLSAPTPTPTPTPAAPAGPRRRVAPAGPRRGVGSAGPRRRVGSAARVVADPFPRRRRGRRAVLVSAAAIAVGGAGGLTAWLLRDRFDERPDDRLVAIFAGRPSPVRAVAFGRDGTLAIGSEDAAIRLRPSSDPGAAPVLLTGHTDRVGSLAFSPDGTRLVSVGWDATIRLWDVAGRRLVNSTADRVGDALYRVTFNSDGTVFATAASYAVRLWETATLRSTYEVRPGALQRAYVEDAVLSPDGGKLAVVTDDDLLVVDVTARTAPLPLVGHTGHIFSAAFSSDNDTVASGSIDGTVRVWSASTGRTLATLTGHRGSVFAVSFSPDGRVLATAGHDRLVRLWDVASAEQVGRPLAGHTNSVVALAFSPDGRLIATGALDRQVRLWRIG